jgi:hypothetical protein
VTCILYHTCSPLISISEFPAETRKGAQSISSMRLSPIGLPVLQETMGMFTTIFVYYLFSSLTTLLSCYKQPLCTCQAHVPTLLCTQGL